MHRATCKRETLICSDTQAASSYFSGLSATVCWQASSAADNGRAPLKRAGSSRRLAKLVLRSRALESLRAHTFFGAPADAAS